MFPRNVGRPRRRFTNSSGYVRRSNSPDVRSIAIYELRSPTDEIARNEWKTTKAHVLLGARTTHVCIARSREVYYFSPTAGLYALRHIFAYPLPYHAVISIDIRYKRTLHRGWYNTNQIFVNVDKYFCNFLLKINFV